ncbi:hypothetical protein EG328_011250 [Venturia inaequalis]|uniref:Uncharacterized protein n=1 Tax=Venturia inaequalis TaxID=5025 RepID=A0A8H3VGG5_VENIN|nr:hypothetical protein EG328_011250 [Venturia inaequalis]KAE9987291.1 hypothetical protein EG327_003867 [Venturia inaequalis]
MVSKRCSGLTLSSSITADILPYIVKDLSSILHTRTDSGAQRIKVLSPYNAVRTKSKDLTSLLRVSPSIIRLRDVKVIKEGGVGPVGGYILAEKGNGDSKMYVRTNAGSAFVEMK